MRKFGILRKRLSCLFLAGIILSTLTGCTDYASYEAEKQPGMKTHIETGYKGTSFSEYEPGEGMKTHIDTDYEGPNLGEYIDSGIEEAKRQGLYTEVDYSGIQGGYGSSGSPNGSTSSGGASSGSTSSGGASSGSTPSGSSGSTSSGSSGSSSSGSTSDPRPDPAAQNSADALALQRFGMLKELAKKEYAGEPYIEVNGNVPYFSDLDTQREPFESYTAFDDLGRVGPAFACIYSSLMPDDDEERGDISSVKPTGWVQAKYDGISNGGWVYNRCHLIAWALTGENANEFNLMTGTRYFNTEGMLPFEMEVLNYLDDNEDGRVLYRAQAVFNEDDLLAKGLLLEARSIDDDEVSFCVYIFNVQPGIEIDYKTGQTRKEG